jgi:uncharacterized membrane protein
MKLTSTPIQPSNSFKILKSIFTTAGIVLGGFMVVAGYILDGIGVFQLGLPIWIWQAIGASIFLILVITIVYDSHKAVAGLEKSSTIAEPTSKSDEIKLRELIAKIERDKIQTFVAHREFRG